MKRKPKVAKRKTRKEVSPIHRRKNGEEIPITKMNDMHLINTISLYRRNAVSALAKDDVKTLMLNVHAMDNPLAKEVSKPFSNVDQYLMKGSEEFPHLMREARRRRLTGIELEGEKAAFYTAWRTKEMIKEIIEHSASISTRLNLYGRPTHKGFKSGDTYDDK